MNEVLCFFKLIAGELTSALQNPLFWVVLVLVAFQYRRIAKSRENLFGISGNTVFRDTLSATWYGFIGGLLGSILLILAGINLTGLAISYIWPLALILMLINPRFLCFSYAGGIVALSNLMLGIPAVDVPQLMGLVAILHLVESMLIYFSGHAGASPMYMKKPSGQIVGGFTLQKFWPLPIVAVAFLSEASGLTLLPLMPDWWPLIQSGNNFILGMSGVLFPFVAGLGYGDLALAHTPVEKSKLSARNLGIYSFILLGLAVLASRFQDIEYLAAVFAPLGHEIVIYVGQHIEFKGKPIFVPPLRGVRLLEAVPNTAVQAAGIRSGDVIYTINGQPVNSKLDIEAALGSGARLLEIEFITHSKKKWQRVIMELKPYQPAGIIPVPEGDEYTYTEFVSQSIISRIAEKIGRNKKGI
ncbi:PDZ domain-containing protein [Phosphitispora sp. TUW77]|uniref:PDZ domain-containing protein n=1 Tax=Phosphitispora sp. TUW77 TaxID=3152361 RepID=UPI003AB251A8